MVSATPQSHTSHIIVALGASALMHLAGVTWSAHRTHTPHPADTKARLLTARIQNTAGQTTRPPSQTQTARHETSPRPQRPQRPQPLPSGHAPITAQVTPERTARPLVASIKPDDSAALKPEPISLPPPKAFGALTSRPIGQGTWGRSSRPLDAETLMQPEQQSMALRSSLQNRLAAMGEIMRMNEQSFTCLIRINLQTRQGQVSCDPTSFEPITWSALQPLITAGDAPGPGPEQAPCIKWTAFEVLQTDCQHIPSPPAQALTPDLELDNAASPPDS